MATINSLGIGSGVLTSDLIEKLRGGDETNLINPITRKIESNQLKLKSFDFLNTLMSTFQTSVSKLSSDTLFLGRSVNGNTDAVTVTAESGSDVQSFSLSDISLAQSEVEHSTLLITSKITALAPSASAPGQFTLKIGLPGAEESFPIDYTSTTTLEQLASAINDKAGAKVTASILQVGPDKYELVVKSDSVGANQAITFTDSLNDGTGLSAALGMNGIQPARDATFNYNGIAITRPSNDISDLLNGVTISLKQNQSVGVQANIAVTQNKTEISTEMSLMVQNYNALITNISDMTAYDKEEGKVGVFNGDNFIRSISREINNIITSVNSEGKSLVDYGITLDRYGVMSLDTAAFNTKMAEDPASLEAFFSGKTVNGVESDGLFDTLYDQMKNYTGYQKQLGTYQSNLNSTLEKLNTDRTKMVERLDNRYEIMSKQFQAYDAMISKFNNQFSSLKQMIEAQYTTK